MLPHVDGQHGRRVCRKECAPLVYRHGLKPVASLPPVHCLHAPSKSRRTRCFNYWSAVRPASQPSGGDGLVFVATVAHPVQVTQRRDWRG